MAILAGLASLIGRFAGRILNTTLGWATILLFGKVPQSRQTLLVVIVFGSLAWIVLVIGVLVPFVGTLLLAEKRPTGRACVVGFMRGYPFAFVLDLVMVVLTVVAVVRRLRALSKR